MIPAFAHYYEARSIDTTAGVGVLSSLSNQKNLAGAKSKESFIGNAREAQRVSLARDCESTASTSSSIAIKLTHLKEAMNSNEEAQRLQRMCRYLKVNPSAHPKKIVIETILLLHKFYTLEY